MISRANYFLKTRVVLHLCFTFCNVLIVNILVPGKVSWWAETFDNFNFCSDCWKVVSSLRMILWADYNRIGNYSQLRHKPTLKHFAKLNWVVFWELICMVYLFVTYLHELKLYFEIAWTLRNSMFGDNVILEPICGHLNFRYCTHSE